MDRCSICPGSYWPIFGDGPRPARYLLIGERPGQNEIRRNRVFVGDAGQEQERYLGLAGIGRGECRIINTVLCGEERNKKPTTREIDGCAGWHIPQEIENTQPFIVILMGAVACGLVEGLDLEVQHGIPFKGKLFGWEGWVCAMYHPAAGMHRTDLMTPLMDDWTRLGKWLENPVEWEMVFSTRHEIARSKEDVERYFFNEQRALLGVDTESHEGTPYSIQVSNAVGTGLMVVLGNEALENRLLDFMEDVGCLVIHNAPADLPIIKRLFGGFPMPGYRDTMQEAYQFQNLPQALKSLVYRLLRKRRRSWDQVVGPWSKEVLREWLLKAMGEAEGKRQVIPRLGKRGQPIKPEVINHPLESKLKGLLTHMSSSESYDPWGKKGGKEKGYRITPEMEAEFGRAPRKGVKWVPVEELVEYGCNDASDALELALLFDTMRQQIVKREWSISDEDKDDVWITTGLTTLRD